ncbi:MAG: hypothetical protein OEY04_08955, partial [Gammaproteobacteria bacterium]|nr:hypothetical protein [Gammaproteobacteria bacterium]
MNQSKSRFWSLLIVTLSLPLAGCPGSNSEEPETEAPDDPVVESTYLIGGVVNGLQSDEILVEMSATGASYNGASRRTGPGTFTFPGRWEDGTTYTVDVANVWQPRNPPQRCDPDPSTASGTVAGADVTDIVIDCVPAYTVGGSVSGLTGGMVILRFDSDDVTALDLEIAANGDFTFDAMLRSGERYSVDILDTSATTTERCRIENRGGSIANANVTNVLVSCERALPLRVQVEGLKGTGLDLENTITDDFAIDPTRYPIVNRLFVNSNGESTFSVGLKTLESYSVTVVSQPSSPDQTCRVYAGEGTVGGTPPDPVEVRCGDATVGGTVTGLLGTGLGLALFGTYDVNGVPTEFELENLTVDEDGEFEFEVTLSDETEFEVRIYRQPGDPDQECIVENGSGTIQGGQNVDDVHILCPRPVREFRYDDDRTIRTPYPLKRGRHVDGAMLDEFKFASGPVIPLGSVVGLQDTPLFQQYIDRPGGDGAIYSNKSGFTYWLVAESPFGVGIPSVKPGGLDPYNHFATLRTIWRFRKTGPNSRFPE